MLPERNEWQILRERFTETAEEENELDQDYINFMYCSMLKKDGEDHKRLLLMNFDVAAHQQLVAELKAENQFDTSKIIQGYLDEYARLFPAR